MADRTITLVLAAKDASAGAFGKFKGSLSGLGKTGAGVGKGMANLGGKIAHAGKLAGLAAIGGIAALVGGLALAVKAAAAEQVGIERLNKALQNNIPGWDGNREAIEKVIDARTRLAFDDSDLRDSLSNLVARTKDVTKALDLQALAMDLARAKGIDLTTASNIIGKVYSGNVGILARYGIAVEKGTSATAALAAIQASTAGQAEAYGKTTAGAFAAFNIAIGNVVEDIGSALLPAVTTFAQFLSTTVIPMVKDIAQKFSDWVAANQPLIDGIFRLVTEAVAGLVDIVFNKVIPGIGTLIGLVGDWLKANEPLLSQIRDGLNVVLTALGDAVKWAMDNLNIVVPFIVGPLVAAFAAWAISAGIAAAATLAAAAPLLIVMAAIGLLAVAWANDWGGIRDIVEKVVNGFLLPLWNNFLLPGIQAIWEAVQKLAEIAVPIFRDVIVPAVQGLWDIVSKVIDIMSNLFDDVVKPAVDAVLPLLKSVLDGIASAFGIVLGWVNDLMGPIGDLLGIIGKVVQGLKDIIDFAGQAIGAAQKVGQDALARGGNDPVAEFFGLKAKGGTVFRNHPYIVGEEGPEAFIPNVSGSIIPNTRLSGAGLNVQMQLNVYGNPDPEAWSAKAVQALTRRLRRERVLAGA